MKNIVTVGGGTGSYTVLSGLKYLKGVKLSALVSMADDGGSMGVLRDELGVLPPGDVRKCLVALSEQTDMVRKLIDYRFENGGLGGHTFGNILLAALEKVTGDFIKGIELASEILKVNGTVIPITKDKARLSLQFLNGKMIQGETKIDRANLQKLDIKKIFYKKNVDLNPNARQAILKADYIILGPGDYYTSIIPHMIVNGFKEAVQKSKAKIILPVNLTNKRGHTIHWKASDYVYPLELYLEKPIDFILVNTKTPSKKQIERYKLKEGDGALTEDDLDGDERVIRTPLLSRVFIVNDKADELEDTRSFIRHDSKKLAKCINKIIKNKK